jgi:NADPH2:quinone reductase
MGKFICIETPDGANALQLRERKTPLPGPGELLLKQTKIGLNFIDIYQTTGLYPLPENGILIPGNEAAGVVLSCGEGVKGFKKGDRVGYPFTIGALAEERTISSDKVVHLPDGITDEIAAGSLLKGMTVEYLINRSAKLQQGQKVLFHAAAGGVGLIAGQWLKAIGVESIGTAGSQEKLELAKSAGFSHVINYNESDFFDAVMDITNGKGVDVVFDSVGKDTYLSSLKVLKRFGMFISFGQSSGVPSEFKLSDLLSNGSLYAQRPSLGDYIKSRKELEEVSGNLFQMIQNGKIKIDINQRFDLADTADAFRALMARKTTGATIIKTSE